MFSESLFDEGRLTGFRATLGSHPFQMVHAVMVLSALKPIIKHTAEEDAYPLTSIAKKLPPRMATDRASPCSSTIHTLNKFYSTHLDHNTTIGSNYLNFFKAITS